VAAREIPVSGISLSFIADGFSDLQNGLFVDVHAGTGQLLIRISNNVVYFGGVL